MMNCETPEQQLLDMAAREEDPKLRELLIATVARKVVVDIFREGKDAAEELPRRIKQKIFLQKLREGKGGE